jgi:ABC-type Zn uptake system ZnuABC Zn-binding protein ZnuA
MDYIIVPKGGQRAKMTEVGRFFPRPLRQAGFWHAMCRAPVCLILLATGLMATGCHRDDPNAGSAASSTTPQPTHPIFATVYPLADVVRQVGGDRVTVQWLCENGLDPRDLHPTDDQVRQATHADLVVTSGFDDAWAGQMLNADRRDAQLLDPAATPAGKRYPHGHGALWLDVHLVGQLTDKLRERLTLLDGLHAEDYRRTATAYAKVLADLEAHFRSTLAPLRGRAFLALRPTWGPMVEPFGLTELAPLDTDPQRLTDDDVRALKRLATEKKTDLLAVDVSLLPGVQRELQLRTGLRLMPLDLLGTSAPDGRSTYLRIMEYNLAQLVENLK